MTAELTRRPLRTLLFAPGSDQRKIERAVSAGADVAVLDLEDAVAVSEKQRARELVAAALQAPRASLPTDALHAPRPSLLAVRVNDAAGGLLEEDVAAVVAPGLDLVVLPKVQESDALAQLDVLLSSAERRCGLAACSVRVIALIETPRGLVRCEQLAEAAGPRLLTLAFGIGDFAASLGVDPVGDLDGLAYARARVVAAALGAGLAPAIDGPFLDLGDERGLVGDSRRSRGFGFQGRVVIHPAQIGPVRRAYGELAPEREAFLRRVLAAFEQAESRGVAAVRVDGRFVDYPIYEQARRALDALVAPGEDGRDLEGGGRAR